MTSASRGDFAPSLRKIPHKVFESSPRHSKTGPCWFFHVPWRGLEPPRLAALAPQASLYTKFQHQGITLSTSCALLAKTSPLYAMRALFSISFVRDTQHQDAGTVF